LAEGGGGESFCGNFSRGWPRLNHSSVLKKTWPASP